MIDTQTNKKRRNNKNQKLEARQTLRSLKKFTQKYLQVIELFKKTNLRRGTSIRHLLFFSKKEHTFSIFSSVFFY